MGPFDVMDILWPRNIIGTLFTGTWFFLPLLTYVWIALCLYIIAKKLNAEYPWLAWIPIANVVLAIQLAGKPWWWIFLFLIPIVNIVLAIIVMWKICEARNKPGWLALLMLIPIANLIIPGIVAFTD